MKKLQIITVSYRNETENVAKSQTDLEYRKYV